jgi:hypothetical protein
MSETISLSQAARHPILGEGGVHTSTVFRWITHGCRGHRLPSLMVGGRRKVRVADLETFISRLTEDAQPEDHTSIQPPARRRREHKRAQEFLASRGI